MGRTPHLGGFFGARSKDKQKALQALDLFEIGHLAGLPFNQLSSGQRQMVLIARAIAQETKLIFMDEPTSALDFKNQIRIWRIMKSLVDRGITIVACSHDPNHVAWFCDKVIVIQSGTILAKGRPREVFNQDFLEEIYPNSCRIRENSKIQLVLPTEMAQQCDLEERS
jgi:iron complex transport system ATP-binding protein